MNTQIKVKETKIFEDELAHEDVLVVEAKLVLVPCKVEDKPILFRNSQGKFSLGIKEPVSMWNPLLVSETEKIYDGDWRIRLDVQSTDYEFLIRCHIPSSNIIKEVHRDNIEREIYKRPFYKVLALPKHFSLQQLQMIVDGKLKDGDKVLIECYNSCPCQLDRCENLIYSIKLNSSNHITLYRIDSISNNCKEHCVLSVNKFGKINECQTNGCISKRLETDTFYTKEKIHELFHEFNQTGYSYRPRTYKETQEWLDEHVK